MEYTYVCHFFQIFVQTIHFIFLQLVMFIYGYIKTSLTGNLETKRTVNNTEILFKVNPQRFTLI